MGSDLDILRSISKDDCLCDLVETLIIQDDSETVDPYAAPELPSADLSYHIWPRSDTGVVLADEIGVADLRQMLNERSLRPRVIKIREYRICPSNFQLCTEMAQIKHLFHETESTRAEAVPIAALAKDVIQDSGIGVESLTIRHVSSDHNQQAVIFSAKFQEAHPSFSAGSAAITETVIETSPTTVRSGDSPFSVLRSAELLLGHEARTSWLDAVFYDAPRLENLDLSIKSMQDQSINAASVVPRLTKFLLTATTISTDIVQAMLASSKESLTHISFRQVTLTRGSTWRELLSFIASNYQALTSFSLAMLREEAEGSPAVDFREFRDDHLPEQHRAGLHLDARGPALNKRTTRLSYDGDYAGEVLRNLARYGYVPESIESGRRRKPS